ncbi:MAG: uncharacterized protein QOI83_359 [Streptomycetaceae bacterium]|nr:uncharacterized protein [Streptomycetaceae bacterium]
MIYLDSSALLKLVFEEAESADLRSWLKARESTVRIASDLSRVEVHRSTLRREPTAVPRAAASMGERVVSKALAIGDPLLRSLDAIHLASAPLLGRQLEFFVAYDKRLLAAAESANMTAVGPGAGA